MLSAKSGGIAALLAASLALSACGGTLLAPLGGHGGKDADETKRAELQARLAELERQTDAAKSEARAAPGPAAPPRQGRFNVKSSGGPLRGFVAGDEPQAVFAARDVLNAGGNAADAAAALYLALAVSYPSAAGLGGGGLCLARTQSGDVESIAFLAKTPSSGGPIAIPGNLAGIAQLQMRHGRLRWRDIVTPAQRLVGAGVVSRAGAQELATLRDVASGNSQFDALTRRLDGAPKREGDALGQEDLAVSLSQIRTSGANTLYRGPLGRAFLDAAHAQGSAMTAAELSAYQPTIATAETFDLSGTHFRLPSLATGAGQLAAEAFSAAREAADRAGIAAAVDKSLASLGAPPAAAKGYGSTSFVVIDGGGREVACAFTMNGPFGAQHVVPGTGILMAKNPASAPEGYGNAFLAPVMAETPGSRAAYLVASGAGGKSALGAVVASAVLSRTNAQLDAAGALADASTRDESANLYLCRARKRESREECSVATAPYSSGLATVIGGR